MIHLFTIVNGMVQSRGECKIRIDMRSRYLTIENEELPVSISFESNFIREEEFLYVAANNIKYILRFRDSHICEEVFERLQIQGNPQITEIEEGINRISDLLAPTYFPELFTIVNGIVQNCGYCIARIDYITSSMRIANGGTPIVMAFNSNFIRENDLLYASGVGTDEHVLRFSNPQTCQNVYETVNRHVAASP